MNESMYLYFENGDVIPASYVSFFPEFSNPLLPSFWWQHFVGVFSMLARVGLVARD